MNLVLAVTQAPIYSFWNGGVDASARQYWARPTQVEWHGPRIDAIAASMSPGDFDPIYESSSDGLFSVRLPSTNAGYAIVDWTPRNIWDAETEQVIHGGKRGLSKIIAYSDITGEWRQLPMPADYGRQVTGTIHYYGLIAQDPATRTIYTGTINTWALDPDTEEYTRLAEHETTNGGAGSMYAWTPDTGTVGGLVKYGGDAQRFLLYDPATNSWSRPAQSLGNGQHALIEYHTAHDRFLLIGGTGTNNRAALVTNAGAVTVVADVPASISMSPGCWIVAHPSGCWLVRSGPDVVKIYACWPNEALDGVTWQDLGAAPDAALTHPTAAYDAARDLIYITATAGLYAYKPPELVAPGSTPAITLVSGSLVYNPAAGPADMKLYLTPAGARVARTTPASGDRLLTLSGGAWHAGAPA